MRILLSILLFQLFTFFAAGKQNMVFCEEQNYFFADTLKNPEVKKIKIKKWLKTEYPNPKKAMILSAVLPGAGQVYNKQWYKGIVIYGGFYGLYRAYDFNNSLYNRFKIALQAELNHEEHEFTDNPSMTVERMRYYRDKFYKDLQLTYIGFGALYVLNIADAYVASHLLTFDISEDLSLQIIPNINSSLDFHKTTFNATFVVAF